MNDLHREIATLRRRIDFLEAENKNLKASMNGGSINLRIHFGTSPAQSKILLLLAKGGVFSCDQIMSFACNGITNNGTVTVHICRIRKFIAPHRIINEWGLGYYLDDKSLIAIRAIINGE